MRPSRASVVPFWTTLAQGVVSAAESLTLHRLRSTLTLLAVSIGVVSVLAVAANGEYARAQLAAMLAQFGSNLVSVTPGSPLTRGARVGKVSTLSMDDATAIAEQVPHVQASSGVKGGSVNAIVGRHSWKTQVQGVSAGFGLIHALRAQSGKFLSADDVQSTAPVAVLGSHVAARLFPGADPVRQQLLLNGNWFTVVGVLADRGQTINGDLDDVIYIPLSTALHRLYGGTSLDRIEVRVDDSGWIGGVLPTITSLLEQRHRIRPGRPDDFQVQNFQRSPSMRLRPGNSYPEDSRRQPDLHWPLPVSQS